MVSRPVDAVPHGVADLVNGGDHAGLPQAVGHLLGYTAGPVERGGEIFGRERLPGGLIGCSRGLTH